MGKEYDQKEDFNHDECLLGDLEMFSTASSLDDEYDFDDEFLVRDSEEDNSDEKTSLSTSSAKSETDELLLSDFRNKKKS